MARWGPSAPCTNGKAWKRGRPARLDVLTFAQSYAPLPLCSSAQLPLGIERERPIQYHIEPRALGQFQIAPACGSSNTCSCSGTNSCTNGGIGCSASRCTDTSADRGSDSASDGCGFAPS